MTTIRIRIPEPVGPKCADCKGSGLTKSGSWPCHCSEGRLPVPERVACTDLWHSKSARPALCPQCGKHGFVPNPALAPNVEIRRNRACEMYMFDWRPIGDGPWRNSGVEYINREAAYDAAWADAAVAVCGLTVAEGYDVDGNEGWFYRTTRNTGPFDSRLTAIRAAVRAIAERAADA